MSKTAAAMPSSVGTVSTENDSMASPEGTTGFTAVNGDSPATSASPPARSPQKSQDDYDKSPVHPPQTFDQFRIKRKRTNSSDEIDRRSPRIYDYSPPKKADNPSQVAGQALHVLGAGHPRAASPVSYHSTNGAGQTDWQNGRSHADVSAADSEDERGQSVEHQGEHDLDDRYSTPPPGQEGADDADSPGSRPGGPVVQIAKRKRNFSNRTKTGCMTCRQRKKKCDEGRPICHNCQRGGFQCQGYTVVRSWSKASAKGPVPLQAKEGHHQQQQQPPPPYGYAVEVDHHGQHSIAPPQQQQPPPLHAHGEAPPHMYVSDPDSRGRPSYTGQSWPPQQGHPLPYTQDQLPPLSDLTRPEPSKADYHPLHPHHSHPAAAAVASASVVGGAAPPSVPQPPPQQLPPPPPPQDMSRPPSQSIPPPPVPPPAPNPQSGHWQPPAHEYRPSYPPPAPRLDPHPTGAPIRAPVGPGYDYSKSGAKTFTVEEVERSRMLRLTKFNYFDPTLKNERQRCQEALARYNNACMLHSGITEAEADAMLRKVFDPSLDMTHHPVAPCKEKGVLCPGVKIEGPFKCTYGYNIRIMDNVFIGENTRIDDSARVDIGARTWIGPNVTILTLDVSKDMVDRRGTESSCIAAPVTIHSEVVVGANAVIYPGVILGRGSTVEPFALVRDNLGENQVQRAAVGHRAT